MLKIFIEEAATLVSITLFIGTVSISLGAVDPAVLSRGDLRPGGRHCT